MYAVIWRNENSSSARGSAWWPMASVVLTICFCITWLGVRWELSPPHSTGIGSPIKTNFLALNPQYPKTLWHGLVISLTGSHPSSLSLPSFLPSASSPGVRVSNSFFLSVVSFIWRTAFCPFSVKLRAAFSSPFLSKHVVSETLLFGPLAPHQAASIAVSLEW